MSGVSIFLHQQNHAVGDDLTGDVVISVSQTLEVHEVRLFIHGKEESRWEEIETKTDDSGKVETHYHKRAHKHCVLDDKLVLAGTGTLQPGQWTYPFTYRLPHHLPASFYEKFTANGRPAKAKVAYELSAEVDVHHHHDLKNHLHLSVGQKVRAPVSPVEMHNKKSFMFNQGNLALRVEVDKSVYFPGDEMKIKLEVVNESVKKVTGLNIDLVRDLTMFAQHHRYTHRDVAHRMRCEGLAEATKDNRLVKFRIPSDFGRMSTDSDVVKAGYHLKVECDVPMAIDLSIAIPVLITVPQHVDLQLRQNLSGQEAEFETMSQHGDVYHESSPLILPENTGKFCGCCLVS